MSATGVQPLERLDQAADHADFSLVLGGPLYQAFRRARLSGDTLELLHRRIVAIVLFAWLPLAILALVAPPAVPVPIPFLRDCDALARFLVALPLLVWAELVVHERTAGVARNFLTRGIIAPADVPRLQAALRSATRVRNSAAIELGLLIFAFTVGHWIWRTQVALTTSTWYAVVDSAGWRLTPAGYWYAFVAIPTFQFILGRWYLRMGIWAWLLWRTSRLPLRLTCTHPDRTAGMAFLGQNRQIVHATLGIIGGAGAVEVDLGKLELRVLVAEERRGMVQIVARALRVGPQPDLGQSALQVAGQGRQRLGDEGCAAPILGIRVGIFVGERLVEAIGLGVVGERPGTRIDARQIKGGEEAIDFRALRDRLLQRRDGHLVVAGLVGAEPLFEGEFG